MTETDEIFVATTEHGEASFICGLAAAGRALPRAAGSRSVSDAAELEASMGVGGWVWLGVRAPYGRPALLFVANVVRVGVSACRRVR